MLAASLLHRRRSGQGLLCPHVWVATELEARAVRDLGRACGGVSGQRLVRAWPWGGLLLPFHRAPRGLAVRRCGSASAHAKVARVGPHPESGCLKHPTPTGVCRQCRHVPCPRPGSHSNPRSGPGVDNSAGPLGRRTWGRGVGSKRLQKHIQKRLNIPQALKHSKKRLNKYQTR